GRSGDRIPTLLAGSHVLPYGGEEPDMRMRTLVMLPLGLIAAVLVANRPLPAVHAQTPPATAGYYTDTQARRGAAAFNRNCAFCHTVDSATTAEQVKTGRGIRIGVAGRSLMNLGGKYLMKVSDGHPDYPSVYYIFNR